MNPTLTFKKSSTIMALGLAFSLIASNPAALAQDTSIIAKVGKRTISKADLDQASKRLSQQFANIPEEQRRARILDALIDFSVLAQAAEKEGYDKDEDYKRTIEYLRVQALHNVYFRKKIESTVTDEALKARYEKQISGITPEKEVHARHILVKTIDEAKAIIEKLNAGSDFIELAKKSSTGPSGPQGGDLGWFGKGRMVPEFEKAAFSMKPGEYSKEPVKTQFGFHVMKVDEVRDVALPTFEKSAPQLRQVLLSEAYEKAVKDNRATQKIEVMDKTLILPATK